MTKIEPGRYTSCFECSTVTAVEESPMKPDEPWCGNCDMAGKDSGIGEVVDIIPCPSPDDCDDINHHYGIGMHMVPIEEDSEPNTVVRPRKN
jgi:hypothetical protein